MARVKYNCDVIKKATLVRLISIKSGCSMGDSKKALEALLEIIPECITQNVGIRLDRIGSFYPVALNPPKEAFLRFGGQLDNMTYEEYLENVWKPALKPTFELSSILIEKVKKDSRGTVSAREAYGDSGNTEESLEDFDEDEEEEECDEA